MKKCIALLAALAAVFSFTALAEYDAPLYAAAVADAMEAEKGEILPLVELTKESPLAAWNEAGDRLLLVSWNGSPELFPDGSMYTTTPDFQLWCVSGPEMQHWLSSNSAGVTDWTLRLEQLIGLPANFGYTHFTAFWVRPEDVFRPAYQPDPTLQVTGDVIDGSALGEFAQWFAGNEQWSYVDSAWPWTRLGYTYDWADNGTEAGLSEFVIRDGAEVKVAWTLTTEEFLSLNGVEILS